MKIRVPIEIRTKGKFCDINCIGYSDKNDGWHYDRFYCRAFKTFGSATKLKQVYHKREDKVQRCQECLEAVKAVKAGKKPVFKHEHLWKKGDKAEDDDGNKCTVWGSVKSIGTFYEGRVVTAYHATVRYPDGTYEKEVTLWPLDGPNGKMK